MTPSSRTLCFGPGSSMTGNDGGWNVDRLVGTIPHRSGEDDFSAYVIVRTGQIFETWLNESSTGVSRPKMETRTLSFCCSALISLTVAGSVAKGPSMTVTDSPTPKATARTTFAVALAGDFV